MQKNSVFLIFFLLLFFVSSCGKNESKKKSSSNARHKTLSSKKSKNSTNFSFRLPDIPPRIKDPQEQAAYLVEHFWDHFPFEEQGYITSFEKQTEQFLVNYISILTYVPKEFSIRSLYNLLESSQKDESGKLFAWFVEKLEFYLYQPNSALKNEPLFLPVAEYLMSNTAYTGPDRVRMERKLRMMLKNPIGEQATDFTYTLKSGKKATLHQLKSHYTLLLFYNPDCHSCSTIIEMILNAPVIKNFQANKLLRVLAVYPDEELDLWAEHHGTLPENWVVAYDENSKILKEELYDLKSSPTILLLDKDKKVLLKDATVEQIDVWLYEHRPVYMY